MDGHFKRDAASFVDAVREDLRQGGKTLAGRTKLQPSVLEDIHAAATEILERRAASAVTLVHIKEAGEKFTAVCYRQRRTIDWHQFPLILEQLTDELTANYFSLQTDAKKTPSTAKKPSALQAEAKKINLLIPVTLRFGNIVPELFKEFGNDFAETPWIIRHSVIRQTDPRKYLRHILGETADILAEDEFKNLADAPSVVHNAVARHKQARAFLQRLQSLSLIIAAEEEFSDFAETPGIIRRAVAWYADPRTFLRGVRSRGSEIAAKSEFHDFATTPGIIRAAVAHHKDPEAFLKRVRKEAAAILKAREFKCFATMPGIVRQIVASQSDPREFLRQRIRENGHAVWPPGVRPDARQKPQLTDLST